MKFWIVHLLQYYCESSNSNLSHILLTPLVLGEVLYFLFTVPGTIQSLEAFAMGSSALYLVWKKPEQENGVLTGYKIYYQTVKGTKVGPLMDRKPDISDPNTTRTKLAGLEPGTKYRIHVKAVTSAGEGEG